MTRLILATYDVGANNLRLAKRADIVIGLNPRFVRGKLPSLAELATFLEARSAKHAAIGAHWLDFHSSKWLAPVCDGNTGLIELCDRCDDIELWVDPQPNDQLILIRLLDLLRSHRQILSKLSLIYPDSSAVRHFPEAVAQWRLPALAPTDDRLQLASRAWEAYCAPTPECCFGLLMEDLTALPRLRAALIALLEELPSVANGLGATEQWIAELASEGDVQALGLAFDVEDQGLFSSGEVEAILDGLAYCPSPVLSGFGDGREEPYNSGARHARYVRSRVAITEFGEYLLDHKKDFCRHNPIHRWWGGTELTNERLWRWDTQVRALVSP